MSMIHFSIALAEKIGPEAAIMYSYICEENRKRDVNKNIHNNRFSLDWCCAHFTFWNNKEILGIINVLNSFNLVDYKTGCESFLLKSREDVK